MQSEDYDAFHEAMAKETSSFTAEKIFETTPLKNKPQAKCLIPFVWSFKGNWNPMGDLIKHGAKLCIHGGRQVKGADYWNTYAPVV